MALAPSVEGPARVVGVQDSLEHDGQARPLPQRGEVLPAEPGVGVDVEEGLDGGPGLGGAQVVPEGAGVPATDR